VVEMAALYYGFYGFLRQWAVSLAVLENSKSSVTTVKLQS